MKELLESPDQEFKVDVINVPRLLTGNVGHMQEQMGNMNEDIETKNKKKARNF